MGWRGEPGVHDELQHLFQGEITLSLLENLHIPSFVIEKAATDGQIQAKLNEYQELFEYRAAQGMGHANGKQAVVYKISAG